MTDRVGGDPACWLDRVCEECGRLMEDDVAHHCPVPRRRDQGGVAGGGPDGGSQGPEMAAEQMPPRGRSNPDCPKGHGELVVHGTIAAT
jgi:hypothetical protein